MGADLWLECPICGGDVRVDELNDIELSENKTYRTWMRVQCIYCGVLFRDNGE